jgi:hypothetical protein
MSLRRLNYITMSGVLPFNFGMDYDAWVRLYATESLRGLVGSDPATWSPEQIAEVNKRAKEETELADRLMALPDDEFYAECKRLAAEQEQEDDEGD